MSRAPVALLLALALTVLPVSVQAEDPPPVVGAAILEDPLTAPTTIRPWTCPTGRAGWDYVGEGLRLIATGRCVDTMFVAGAGPTMRELDLPDGEIRFEVKAVSGVDRVRVGINARNQPGGLGGLTSPAEIPPSAAVAIEPGLGRALIGNPAHTIVDRTDLAEIISADDWNTVALRAKGPEFWLLVNDQPVLYFSDTALDRGGVSFSVLRLSQPEGEPTTRVQDDPADTTEVAVVVRNLRVSALADGDPTRAPTYQRP